MVTPASSRCPRTTAVTAVSSPANARSASARVSVAHHNSAPVCSNDCARPRARELVEHVRHSVARPVITSELSRSWSSSGPAGSATISSCTRSMASCSSRPIDVRSTARPRRRFTALTRRFWNSSSSRNAYGRAVRISCASTDGSVVSTQCTCTSPSSIASSSARSPSRVERLVQGVVDGLAHDQVVGDLDRADLVVLARRRAGEHRGHEVVGLHALDRWRVLPAAPETEHEQRPVEVPPPAGEEHRRVEDRVLERVVDGVAAHVARDLFEWERVVRPERQHDRVVGGRRLQLEVERAAELLAQRDPERPVDAPAVRRVDHELHAARLVEEALEHEVLQGGHHAQHRAPDREVVDDHRRGFLVHARVLAHPRPCAVGIARREQDVDARTQHRHLFRELVGARRCLTEPERHGGRGITRVAHPHDPGLDAADLPRVGAEQEDVARHRLDGPVFVDGADERVVGLRDDAVVAGLGDRAARRERGDARALARPHLLVDRVVVQVAARAARDRSRRRWPRGRSARRTARATGRGTARPCARARRGRRWPNPGPRPRRSAAATRCRAACARGGWHRGARRGRPRATPRTRRARRVSAGRGCPWARRAACGWSGRRAAGTWRCCAVTRSGTPAPPGRCRCRARATRWPPGT